MGQRMISVFLLFVLADFFGNVVVCQVDESNTSCLDGPGPVYFRMYNSSDSNGTLYDMNSKNITLDKGKPIYILIHGFRANPYSKLWQILFGVIVIIVDWRIGACSCDQSSIDLLLLQYSAAANNTRAVGKLVTEFFTKLIDYGASPETTTVIGHSLGGHVAGFFGKLLQVAGLGLLYFLQLLDLAGPEFQEKPCEDRACITDAACVSAVHTSASLGMSITVGDMDFYVNGGVSQPGCSNLTNSAMCSHVYSMHYYIHAICGPNCTYIGKQRNILNPLSSLSQCSQDTCKTLSLQMDCRSPNGIFDIDTTKMSSYCRSLYVAIPSLLDSIDCTTS